MSGFCGCRFTLKQYEEEGMSKIHEMRKEADRILDGLEARAAALENRINETNEQFADRFQDLKNKASANAEAIEARVKQVPSLADEQKQKIAGSIEHLQLQLALGRVAAKDTLHEQKQMISNAAAAARAHIVANLDQMDADLNKEIDAWIDALEKLDAEMEAAELAWDAEWRASTAAAKADWEANKQDVKTEIAAFRSKLKQRKDMAEDKLGDFHREMAEAFNQIGSAFRNLAS
jgi:uncharacterized protein Yka (UPF0111/DUF47 family)